MTRLWAGWSVPVSYTHLILKVGYAPKEQYIRRSRQGPYTDVYSCAACFYAALTGFLPPESLERLDQDTLVPVSQCGVDIPEYLDKVILKGLAVQPEDRFQSAAEFLEAIESQQVVEVPPSGSASAQSAQPERKRFKPAPVSYTHLDVYKRQPSPAVSLLPTIREFSGMAGILK